MKLTSMVFIGVVIVASIAVFFPGSELPFGVIVSVSYFINGICVLFRFKDPVLSGNKSFGGLPLWYLATMSFIGLVSGFMIYTSGVDTHFAYIGAMGAAILAATLWTILVWFACFEKEQRFISEYEAWMFLKQEGKLTDKEIDLAITMAKANGLITIPDQEE